MTTKDKTKEALFCAYYAYNGTPITSARLAGWSRSEAPLQAARLLSSKRIQSRIAKLRAAVKEDLSEKALQGMKNLAFNPSNDAFRFLDPDHFPNRTELDKLDLSQVLSVKRDKSGNLEIHFIDKGKIMTDLYNFANTSADKKSAAQLLSYLTPPSESAPQPEQEESHAAHKDPLP